MNFSIIKEMSTIGSGSLKKSSQNSWYYAFLSTRCALSAISIMSAALIIHILSPTYRDQNDYEM